MFFDNHSADKLSLPHGTIALPAFLPDATLGVVRTVDTHDLHRAGVQALVMNVFHLMQKPGSSTIRALGGLHAMAHWHSPIVTDSGGFQAYSLIRQNAAFGTINDDSITFRPEGRNRSFHLTPEKSIQLQLAYGADIVICLDDCTHVDNSYDVQQASVRRTIAWAKRCKDEFERQISQRQQQGQQQQRTYATPNAKPFLFGVVQGGGYESLRKECAEALLDIGFDGFGYGGWPLDRDNQLLHDMLDYTRSLIPASFAMHALGIGHPPYIVACTHMGYQLFDSSMPTRDARHGRLYTFTTPPSGPTQGLDGDWFAYLYINDEKHVKARKPISEHCDCVCCQTYTRGYLHHLYKVKDALFERLATIHNLRCMTLLMERLRARAKEQTPWSA